MEESDIKQQRRLIEYELLSTNTYDWGFPPPNAKLNISSEDVNWKYAFKFHVQNFAVDAKCIRIELTCKLHYNNPKKKTSIARVQLGALFRVKGANTMEEKLFILYKALEIANWNLQGMFAAGLEDTQISSFVVPLLNFGEHEEDFIKKLSDEWN